jgi:hypothetical protein
VEKSRRPTALTEVLQPGIGIKQLSGCTQHECSETGMVAFAPRIAAEVPLGCLT